jgi:hypothetical protein
MEQTYFYVLYEYKQGVWTPVTRYSLTPSMIQGIYSAQILNSSQQAEVHNFALLSEAELPNQIGILSYEEAYTLPLQNLNDYRIIRSGEREKIYFHRLQVVGNDSPLGWDAYPFTHFITFCSKGNENTSRDVVKIISYNSMDFINGFVMYYELLYRYSQTGINYPSFQVMEAGNMILYQGTLCDWLFNSLFPELQKEITDFMPLQFMLVSKKYYDMYASQLSINSKGSDTKRLAEINRRLVNNYSFNRIAELLIPESYIIESVLHSSANNLKFLNHLIRKYHRTVGQEIVVSALINAQRTWAHDSRKIDKLILKLIRNKRYSFSNSQVAELFVGVSTNLAPRLFKTGRVGCVDVGIFVVGLLGSAEKLSLGALTVIINSPEYDISYFADRMIITLVSNFPLETDLLKRLANDSRVTSDHLCRVLSSYRGGGDSGISKLLHEGWNKIRLNANSIIVLVQNFPQLILPVLESEGMLDNKDYTEVYVTPYINETINNYLQELSKTSPNVIRYLLTIPTFNPSYNYNIVARTLIKYDHVDALRELLKDNRVVLGPGTRKAILENPLLRHLLDEDKQ